MKKIFIILLFACPIFSQVSQELILQDYFPEGERVWVFEREEGVIMISINGNIPRTPSPYNFHRYSISMTDSLLSHVHYGHCSSDETLLLNFNAEKGQFWRFSKPCAPGCECIHDDTTLTTQLGTFEHCKIFKSVYVCPSDTNYIPNALTGDSVIIAPEIGLIQNVIFAKVAGKTWGTLPEGITEEDLKYTQFIYPTTVDHKKQNPNQFFLNQNYPNPFNGSTTLSFNLESPYHVNLTIYGINGRKVKTFVDEQMASGQYQIKWNATDDLGNAVPSGLYFARMTSDEKNKQIKLVYTK
jgi:hypothetical protein